MTVSRLLGATAIATVLAMPAAAQTVIFQGTNVGVDSLLASEVTVNMMLNQAGGFNFATMPLNLNTLSGADYSPSSSRNLVSEVVQIGTGNLNVAGLGDLTGADGFAIAQGAGTYVDPFGGEGADTYYGNTVISIVNANGLWGNNPLQSSTSVRGSQIGQITVNSIDMNVAASMPGQIWQQAGTDGVVLAQQPPGAGIPVGPVLSVDNAMIAITQNGLAEVRGTTVAEAGLTDDNGVAIPFEVGGTQAAIVNLNTVNIGLAAGVTLDLGGNIDQAALGLKQELSANNSIAVRNTAVAVSLANATSIIDPLVSDIRQMSVANINTVAFSTEVAGVNDGVNQYGSATVNLAGYQDGDALTGTTYVRLGNLAAAVAGEPDLGAGLNNPSAWTDANGAGIAVISNVQQIAALQLNTISNPIGNTDADEGAVGGVNLNLSGLTQIEGPTATAFAFDQYFDGNLTIVPYVLGGTNIVNLQVASVGTGSARIENSSQAFVLNINSVDVGGTLSGGLNQYSSDVGTSELATLGTLQNVAVANVNSGNGAASIKGLQQVMQQSYNSVGAGNLNNFSLVQDASDINLGAINTASALSNNGAASLANVVQVSSLSVNTLSAGGLNTNSGLISQTTSNVNLGSMNTLQVSGLTSSVTGAVQQATSNINVMTAR